MPFASGTNALDDACHALQNARHIAGPLQPLEAAAPLCWSASPTVGPAPPAGALVHGDELCAYADARADRGLSGDWYRLCGQAASLGAEARVRVTQTQVSPAGCNPCTYAPTYHVDLSTLAPGEWVVRAQHHLRKVSHFGVGGIVDGSTRVFECRASEALQSCHAERAGPQVTAGNFNTFLWEGAWALSLVDAAGVEHVQARGGDARYVAQYYQP